MRFDQVDDRCEYLDDLAHRVKEREDFGLPPLPERELMEWEPAIKEKV